MNLQDRVRKAQDQGFEFYLVARKTDDISIFQPMHDIPLDFKYTLNQLLNRIEENSNGNR